MTFNLETAEFSGPIEALLTLIEKRKLPISDVSLVAVTDEYLRFVKSLSTRETIPERVHFIYIASTLALIKSKSLLPNLELTDEEETDIESLKKRLALYQEYKKIGKYLGESFQSNRSFFLANDRPKEIRFSPHEDITISSLVMSLKDILREVPQLESTKKEGYVKIAVHIEELMDSLLDRVKNQLHLSFHSFLGEGKQKHEHKKEQKVYTVVSFLALLEVVRNHGIDVQQHQLFSDIVINQ